MTFALGPRSLARLEGVHPDLVRVVKAAILTCPVDFTVLQGVRTLEEQKAFVAAGKSQTLNSRHLTGHAVDLGAWVNDTISWDAHLYPLMATSVVGTGQRLGVPIIWGGTWRTIKDLDHFELSRETYP